MKEDGYPMGTHRVSHRDKTITVHFRKWNDHACRHFVFEMPCCIYALYEFLQIEEVRDITLTPSKMLFLRRIY